MNAEDRLHGERPLTFANSFGTRLAGVIDIPGVGYPGTGNLEAGIPEAGEQPNMVAAPFPVVVFSHGFDSGKDSPRGLVVAKELWRAGVATFRFDFTGHGKSEGRKEDSTIEQQTKDLVSALDQVEAYPELLDARRVGVSGASSGAVVALEAAARDARIRLLALRSPSPRPHLPRVAQDVQVPTLVVETDEPLLLSSSTKLCESLAGESRLEVIHGAGHLFEGPGSLERMAALVAEWCAERLAG